MLGLGGKKESPKVLETSEGDSQANIVKLYSFTHSTNIYQVPIRHQAFCQTWGYHSEQDIDLYYHGTDSPVVKGDIN